MENLSDFTLDGGVAAAQSASYPFQAFLPPPLQLNTMNFVEESSTPTWTYRAVALPEQLLTLPSGEVVDFRSDPIPTIAHYSVLDTSLLYLSRPSTIWYTDEASRRNTDTVRRVCFNCRTGDSPSWRRSRLVPGKILCNKCGLYEHAHSRARPHRVGTVRQGTVTKGKVDQFHTLSS